MRHKCGFGVWWACGAAIAASLLATAVCGSSGAAQGAGESSGAARELVEAVKARDTNRVAALLRGGADPNARGRFGRVPLHYAAELRDTNMVSLLLASGASPNMQESWGDMTPLLLAAERGDAAVLGLLLRHGAATTPQCVGGKTALHCAVASHSPAAVRILLAAGADPNATDDRGVTPVMTAQERGERFDLAFRAAVPSRSSIVGMLIHAGARVNITTRGGENLLHGMARAGQAPATKVLTYLIRHGVDVNGRESDGMTPLMLACHASNELMVRALLTVPRTDLNAKEIVVGETALHFAAELGEATIARLLLRAGAQRGITNDVGQTAADVAAEAGYKDLAKALKP